MKRKNYYLTILSIVLTVTIISLCIFVLQNFVQINRTNNAKQYISNKYNIEETIIAEDSYIKQHIDLDFVLFEKFNIWVVPSQWKFNINEKKFTSEYGKFVLELNSGFNSKNCTLIPILHSSTIQLQRTNRCKYLFYNKNVASISCKEDDVVVYDFTINKR